MNVGGKGGSHDPAFQAFFVTLSITQHWGQTYEYGEYHLFDTEWFPPSQEKNPGYAPGD